MKSQATTENSGKHVHLNLSETFKESTSHIHKTIEEHPFLVLLCKEELTPVQYFSHLIDLKCVYDSLDDSIKSSLAKEPRLKNICFKGLERSSALKKDLLAPEFFGLTGTPSTQAKAYKHHLEKISNVKPILLIAHAYTRYLGDLSGGMMLKRHIANAWPHAVNFYDFDSLLKDNDLESVKAFKELFKTKINSLQISAEELEALSLEANEAFILSGNLFNAIIPNAKLFCVQVSK